MGGIGDESKREKRMGGGLESRGTWRWNDK